MRPFNVVADVPLLNDVSGFFKSCEPFLIQTLLAKTPVEGLDLPVLGGLTRLDEEQGNLVFHGPDAQWLSSKLRSVIIPQSLRYTVPFKLLIQRPLSPARNERPSLSEPCTKFKAHFSLAQLAVCSRPRPSLLRYLRPLRRSCNPSFR